MARILIVGGGAREHALGRALASEQHSLFFLPGNAGTAALGENMDGAGDDPAIIAATASLLSPDLVVIGPEKPLVLGAADVVRERGMVVFGPGKAASALEGSKAFMKDFCARHAIPTAPYRVFEDPEAAWAYVNAAARPLVVKADGLCAGKGVVVAADAEEASAAIQAMMVDRVFGDAGASVVIEEVLPGEEASFHVLVANGACVPLAPAQDHKRVFDGDRGPNTGGMGAYAPAPIVTPEVHSRIMKEIVAPTLRGLEKDGLDFRGVLFVGLMIEDGVPRVLEFNVRFGDPETSVILPLLDRDPFELLRATAEGKLAPSHAAAAKGSALTVVLAAEGYPGAPTKGDEIEGLAEAESSGAGWVLHAGTERDGERVLTAGGRVLAVGAAADTFDEAHARAYELAGQISFRGMHYRKDIGARAMKRA